MNSMVYLPTGWLRIQSRTLLYVSTRVSPVTPMAQHKAGNAAGRSMPRIADQRLAGPEHQHQHDTQYPHDGENRLVQDHPDDTVPEPGRMALHPGPCLLYTSDAADDLLCV